MPVAQEPQPQVVLPEAAAAAGLETMREPADSAGMAHLRAAAVAAAAAERTSAGPAETEPTGL